MAALYRTLLTQLAEGDDQDTEIDTDSLACGGKMCRKCVMLYERYHTLQNSPLANLKTALGVGFVPKQPRTEAKMPVYPHLSLLPASSSTSTSPDVAVSPSISFIQKPFIFIKID